MQAIAIFKENHNGLIKCAFLINGNNTGKIQTIANDYRQYIKAGYVELKFLPAALFDPILKALNIDQLRRDNKTGFKVVKSSGKQCRKKPVSN